MANKIVMKNVRLSFANIFKARRSSKTDPASKMVYGTGLLIPKNHPQLADLNKMIDAVGTEKFGKKWTSMRAKKDPVHDGDVDREDDPAYKGMLFINANSERKPQLVDKRMEVITSEDEIYSGCYVNCSFNVYAFEGDTNKGVTFGLNNIQLINTGERLGGVAGADEDFEEIDDDDVMS